MKQIRLGRGAELCLQLDFKSVLAAQPEGYRRVAFLFINIKDIAREKTSALIFCGFASGRTAMAFLQELGVYQAKVLRTAKAIVDLDGRIAATVQPEDRKILAREADKERAMLRAYEGMVAFLNCCIEIDRKSQPEDPTQEPAKKRG